MKYRYLKKNNQNLTFEDQQATSADTDTAFSPTPSKLKPPFTKMPSFHIAALVCSFYGYSDEVKDLHRQLSRNNRIYYLSHQSILNDFIIHWLPEITNKVEFGNNSYRWTSGFKDWNRKYYAWGGKHEPNEQEVENFSRYATMKLTTVRYKTYQNELSGIKLEFSNGLQTPLFETNFS